MPRKKEMSLHDSIEGASEDSPGVEFRDQREDTAENREIAELVEKRYPAETAEDLDQVIRQLGHNPAEFLRS
jgi:hypothetical protein